MRMVRYKLMRLLRDRINVRWNILLALSSGFAGLLIINANLLDISRLRIQVPFYVLIVSAAFVLIDRLGIRARVTKMNRRWQMYLAGILSIYSCYVMILHYLSYFARYQPHIHIGEVFVIKLILFVVLGFFAIYTAWRFFFWAVYRLNKRLDFTQIEKRLIVCYTTLCLVIAVLLSIFVTNHFVLKLNIVDTLYAMDSQAFIYDETYDNNVYGLGTDIRHPLVQAINTPFGIISRVIGQIFHFVPYAQTHVYQMFLVIMVAITGILLIRLLGVKSDKLKVATFILYVCLYSTLIFTFAVEQYVQVVLLMVLMVYALINKWPDRWIVAFLVMSAGYTLTSAALGTVLLIGKGTPKQKLKRVAVVAAAFILLLVASGKLLTLIFFNRVTGEVSKFSLGVDFLEKIYQFVNFMATTVTAGFHTVIFDGSYHHYKTDDINMVQLNLVGIVVLLLIALGFYVGRKKLLNQIALGWVIYSFIVCVVVGWGSSLNEYALYSAYFGWAYFILLFSAVSFIVDRFVPSLKIQERILIAVFSVVSLVNIIQFRDVIVFAHEYYPARPIEEIVKEYIPYEKKTQ